jgi:hypothetical protein
MKKSKGDYFIIFDSDCIIQVTWLKLTKPWKKTMVALGSR